MYAWFTWFHADMYFSMHEVKHVCSPLETDDPGFGRHFSKQTSFIFSMSIRAFEVLDSSWTWRMTVCLIVLESMVGLVGFNGQGAKRERSGC